MIVAQGKRKPRFSTFDQLCRMILRFLDASLKGDEQAAKAMTHPGQSDTILIRRRNPA